MITGIFLFYKIDGVKNKRDGRYMVKNIKVIIGGHQFKIKIVLNNTGNEVTGYR